MANIGPPQREIIIEPLASPVPAKPPRVDTPPPVPVAPATEPVNV